MTEKKDLRKITRLLGKICPHCDKELLCYMDIPYEHMDDDLKLKISKGIPDKILGGYLKEFDEEL